MSTPEPNWSHTIFDENETLKKKIIRPCSWGLNVSCWCLQWSPCWSREEWLDSFWWPMLAQARTFSWSARRWSSAILHKAVFTLRKIEQLGDCLDFKQHLLISRLVTQLIEVLVHQCLSGRDSFDGRVLQHLCDEVDQKRVSRLQQLHVKK